MDTLSVTATRFLRALQLTLKDASGEFDPEQLHDVEEALSRIDEGTYGVCEHCGGAIGRQRLAAIPEARYCMGCDGSMERLVR